MRFLPFEQLVIMALQVPNIPVDRLLDELFESTPTRLVFVVMIVALISIPVMVFGFLVILRRISASNATAQDKLVGVIDKLQTYANTLQEHNSENYLMITTQLEQISGIFTTISTELADNQQSQNSIMSALADVVLQVQTQTAQTKADVQTYFKHELTLALEEILDQRRLDLFDTFSPPLDDDCRFKIRLVRAAIQPDNPQNSDKDILLSKAPIFKNDNEAGRLRGSGEIVRIIEQTSFSGWSYVKAMFPSDDPEKQAAGYVRTHTIMISELTETPAAPSG